MSTAQRAGSQAGDWMQTERGLRQCAPTNTAPAFTKTSDLARTLTLLHAQARAAQFFLPADPAAAIRALRDVRAHTSAALAALPTAIAQDLPPRPLPAAQAPIAAAVVRGGLVALRSAGGTFYFAVTGDEHQLASPAEAAVARVVHRCLHEGAQQTPAGTVSLTMTWSPDRLDVLAVITGQSYTSVRVTPPQSVGEQWRVENDLMSDLGGSFRVHRQSGGTVVAISLPSMPAHADIDLSPAATSTALQSRP